MWAARRSRSCAAALLLDHGGVQRRKRLEERKAEAEQKERDARSSEVCLCCVRAQHVLLMSFVHQEHVDRRMQQSLAFQCQRG